MEVICLHEPAFYALINEVVSRIKATEKISEDRWISTEEAMAKLRIKSTTTLQKLRDEGKIGFAQDKRMILYDLNSIYAYLESTYKKPF